MLRSMTGYGRGVAIGETFTVTVELRSVNNRNLDIHWRAPHELAQWEIPLKKQVQAAIARGRVDVIIAIVQTEEVGYELNRQLIRSYLAALRTMRDEFGLAGETDLATLVRLPNVLQSASSGNALGELIVQGVEEALMQALTALVAMRAVEGHDLQRDMLGRVGQIEKQLIVIEANAATLVQQSRDKLRARLSELLTDITLDEVRLAQEVAYLAERSDIAEEIARLRTHIAQFAELLTSSGAIGKKLDFLLQEANREANTILSKSSELTVCNAAIEIKAEVEKLREQAQNVE